MPKCNNCGAEISNEQYNNYDGLCPECKRLEPVRKKAEFETKSGKASWIFLAFICIASLIGVSIFFFFSGFF